MDNKRLADLLFPKVKMTIYDIFKRYPKRNLKAGAEVVRIAPSPTGFLHIGSVYGALIDKLISYHTGGIYYMRLEDTDKKRRVSKAGEIAYNMLCTFHLKPDEGYMGAYKEVGKYGSYVQSKRKDIYLAFAKYLVLAGKAYPCFCRKDKSKDDIVKKREEEIKKTSTIEQKDKCRDLSLKEIEERVKNKVPFAIRLRSSGVEGKSFLVHDRIKGDREIRENTKDVVILKSNFIPPYNLAHVVDDTLMGTTTVVRGEEWFPSLSSHLELFKALNLRPPKYAHTPVICKIDSSGHKRKLSKRKDPEADARYFIREGYPIDSVLEYLMNLINSDFEDWRKNNPNLSYLSFPFKISKIGSNNPIFDFKKLGDCSKEVISKKPAKMLYMEALKWGEKYDRKLFKILKEKKNFCISILKIDRDNFKKPRKDIEKYGDILRLYDYMLKGIKNRKLGDYEFDKKVKKEDIIDILKEYKDTYRAKDSKEVWFDKIRKVAGDLKFAQSMKEYRENMESYKGNISDVAGVIRVAITTKSRTPDLYYLSKLLGKEEVIYRVTKAINLVERGALS